MNEPIHPTSTDGPFQRAAFAVFVVAVSCTLAWSLFFEPSIDQRRTRAHYYVSPDALLGCRDDRPRDPRWRVCDGDITAPLQIPMPAELRGAVSFIITPTAPVVRDWTWQLNLAGDAITLVRPHDIYGGKALRVLGVELEWERQDR